MEVNSVEAHGARVTDDCELCRLSAGNQTRVLCTSSKGSEPLSHISIPHSLFLHKGQLISHYPDFLTSRVVFLNIFNAVTL